MKIFMTGGTGFVGSRLASALAGDGHEIHILSRSPRSPGDRSGAVSFIQGDPACPGAWQDEVRACDAAINLAGTTIFKRWTKKRKREILESRVEATRNLVDAIEPGRILISASAVGYYGARGEEELGEDAAAGEGFLAEIASAWEREAERAESKGARVAVLRFGIVLGNGGGALSTWVPLFKAGLGGRLGDGRQWFSWIHIDDLVGAVGFILANPGVQGPVNVCSPNPVRNADLAKALGTALHRPAFFAVPGFAVRIVLGEFAGSVLTGQRVLPRKLAEKGFVFCYPEILPALRASVRDRRVSA